jgi:hypothetical protein
MRRVRLVTILAAAVLSAGCVDVAVRTEFATDGTGARSVTLRGPTDYAVSFEAIKGAEGSAFLGPDVADIPGLLLTGKDAWTKETGYAYYAEEFGVDVFAFELPLDPSIIAQLGGAAPEEEVKLFAYAGSTRAGRKELFVYAEAWYYPVSPLPTELPTLVNVVEMPGPVIMTNGQTEGGGQVRWDVDTGAAGTVKMFALSELGHGD